MTGCYDTPVGTYTGVSSVPRVIARIFPDGHWDTSVAFTGVIAFPNIFTSVFSMDGRSSFYMQTAPYYNNYVALAGTSPTVRTTWGGVPNNFIYPLCDLTVQPTSAVRTAPTLGATYYLPSNTSTTATLIFASTVEPYYMLAWSAPLNALVGVAAPMTNLAQMWMQFNQPLPTTATTPIFPFSISGANSYYTMYRYVCTLFLYILCSI